MLRIIAGRYKGRRLQTARWEGLRPTSDRLRETLFNVLAPRIEGARVLDGFAGTGAIGIEALSRGARHVTFAEADRRAVALLTANLARCGVADGYTICALRIDPATTRWPAASFEAILLDPPYDDPDLEAYVAMSAPWLAPGGLLVLEHAARRVLSARCGALELRRTVRAGDSALAFYEMAAEATRATEATKATKATGRRDEEGTGERR